MGIKSCLCKRLITTLSVFTLIEHAAALFFPVVSFTFKLFNLHNGDKKRLSIECDTNASAINVNSLFILLTVLNENYVKSTECINVNSLFLLLTVLNDNYMFIKSL